MIQEVMPIIAKLKPPMVDLNGSVSTGLTPHKVLQIPFRSTCLDPLKSHGKKKPKTKLMTITLEDAKLMLPVNVIPGSLLCKTCYEHLLSTDSDKGSKSVENKGMTEDSEEASEYFPSQSSPQDENLTLNLHETICKMASDCVSSLPSIAPKMTVQKRSEMTLRALEDLLSNVRCLVKGADSNRCNDCDQLTD